MRKILTVLLLLSLLAASFVFFSSANEGRVCDPYGLVSAENISALETKFAAAESESGVLVRAYINDATKSGYVSEYKMLSELGLSYDSDLVLLLIEKMSDSYYEYELFTYGSAYNLISDGAADAILDSEGVHSIKRGAIYEGLGAFAEISADEIVQSRKSTKVTVIVVSVIIALAAGFGAAVGVYYTYKRKLKSPIYPLSKYANLNLEYSSDNFVGSNVIRTRINTSSGGSRGGGGRGGGSRGRR